MRKLYSRGFSILEIMVALLILGIGFVAVTKFQGTTVKNSNLTAQRAEAINLAQAKIENLRLFAYDFNKASDTNTENGITAVYTISSSIAKSATLPNSVDISVVVTWPDISHNGAVTDDTTVAISTVLNEQGPMSGVMSDSVPSPDLANDPTVDVVLCTCSGSTSSGFSHMSAKRPRLDFFIKTGGGHNWSAPQTDAICDSCCSLPAGSTGSFGGGMMGGGSNDYLCSVRQGQGHMRWQW